MAPFFTTSPKEAPPGLPREGKGMDLQYPLIETLLAPVDGTLESSSLASLQLALLAASQGNVVFVEVVEAAIMGI